jgi:hypothetical protein
MGKILASVRRKMLADERNSDLDRSCNLQGIIVQRQRSTDVDDRRSSEATRR